MRLGLACVLLLMSGAQAMASANVSCSIDDRVLAFELEAIAGRSSPINQIQVGSIAIKPGAKLKLTKPKIELKLENLVQQWMLGGDLRLQFEAYDEASRENVNLTIVTTLDRKSEKYSGNYTLTVTADGNDKVFKGRVKQCEAG